MNYEEKYRKALDAAKMYYKENKDFGADFLPIIFPELRESEDERIRKEIIQSIQDNMCVIHKDKCLAWLEKQGEQKLAESISQLTIQGKGFYKICPYCKERMVRDESKVYTSIPPQYEYKCPKCGTMEFDTVMYDNPEMEEQISADKVEPKFEKE